MLESILQAIGHTPLVKLKRVGEGLQTPVFVKMEMMNPGGSVKDRVGLAMINEAERRGWLRTGGTIIEATAGNTGVGLAMAAAVKGYRCIFVLPDKMSNETIALAHTLLGIAYHVLKRETVYAELGPDYFERRDRERLTRKLVDRLERLGHRVILEAA